MVSPNRRLVALEANDSLHNDYKIIISRRVGKIGIAMQSTNYIAAAGAAAAAPPAPASS